VSALLTLPDSRISTRCTFSTTAAAAAACCALSAVAAASAGVQVVGANKKETAGAASDCHCSTSAGTLEAVGASDVAGQRQLCLACC
jgi:hypothetical protein